MRIYHDIEEITFDDPEKQEVIGRAVNEQIQTLAELHKYKMMWALRSIEKELDQWGGMICLISKHGHAAKIELRGFTDDQESRIHSLLTLAGIFK